MNTYLNATRFLFKCQLLKTLRLIGTNIDESIWINVSVPFTFFFSTEIYKVTEIES